MYTYFDTFTAFKAICFVSLAVDIITIQPRLSLGLYTKTNCLDIYGISFLYTKQQLLRKDELITI